VSAVVGSQYGDTTGAAEYVIAQLYSQGKLTTPSHKNRKIRHENEILKSNRIRSACVQTSDLSNDTKKHITKTRETIPLNFVNI
jgi:hypothetical protein